MHSLLNNKVVRIFMIEDKTVAPYHIYVYFSR